MARSDGRTAPCTASVRQGRMDKAAQFLEAARLVEAFAEDDELSDALVTVCVHAGIAAADVICCVALGRHAKGEDHTQAVALLPNCGSRGCPAPERAVEHEDAGRVQPSVGRSG